MTERLVGAVRTIGRAVAHFRPRNAAAVVHALKLIRPARGTVAIVLVLAVRTVVTAVAHPRRQNTLSGVATELIVGAQIWPENRTKSMSVSWNLNLEIELFCSTEMQKKNVCS